MSTLPEGLEDLSAVGEAGRAAGEEDPQEAAEDRDREHQDEDNHPQNEGHQIHIFKNDFCLSGLDQLNEVGVLARLSGIAIRSDGEDETTKRSRCG